MNLGVQPEQVMDERAWMLGCEVVWAVKPSIGLAKPRVRGGLFGCSSSRVQSICFERQIRYPSNGSHVDMYLVSVVTRAQNPLLNRRQARTLACWKSAPWTSRLFHGRLDPCMVPCKNNEPARPTQIVRQARYNFDYEVADCVEGHHNVDTSRGEREVIKLGSIKEELSRRVVESACIHFILYLLV